MKTPFFLLVTTILLFFACQTPNDSARHEVADKAVEILEVNEAKIPVGTQTFAITGATLIDGTGDEALFDAVVVVVGNTITAVGKAGEVEIPADAERIDASGLFLLPGLIDAHFHLARDDFPSIFLTRGVTSMRDPGAWIESYEAARALEKQNPRLFLTGPHLDMWPPAYPKNSWLLQDRKEARVMVNHFVDQGASAIKVYFRLSLGLIEEVCATAHERGIPVTAHLEIADARNAIRAGLDGIEHITSLGTALQPTREAAAYRLSILADNNNRRQGRYEVWSQLDLNHPRTDSLIQFLVEQKTFVCPTLGAFEYRFSEEKEDSVRVKGFEKMLAFTGKAYRAGVRMVVGSHGAIPYGGWGWGFQHEMELLSEAGMKPEDIIVGGTLENARFFWMEDRLGSIEVGKQADLILVKGNPLENISAMRNIERVMLNGVWVPTEQSD